MKILFSTFGSLGDIHPYLAVALEAQKRGHEPILATSPKYRAKIESLGLEFRPIRPDLPNEDQLPELTRRVMDLKTGTQFLFETLLMPPLRQSYADLLEAGEDADLIITHPAAPAAPLAAQKLGKKWLSSALAPISLWSVFDPPVPPTMPQLEFLRIFGPPMNRIFFWLSQRITRPWVAVLDELCIEEGLPPARHPMFEGQYSPFGTLALFSPFYYPRQRDWPVNTTATGFCFFDQLGYANPDTSDWRNWLEAGEPPIVFTLGSSAVFDAGDFWHKSVSVALDYEKRALLLVGPQFEAPNHWPDSVKTAVYAPYSELFPRAQLIVHQGGIGTTAQALRAGVPQIVMPYAHDQPDNAARLRRLGVALDESKKRYPGEAFEWMMDDYPKFARKAKEIGEKIRAENGPKRACEAMERFA